MCYLLSDCFECRERASEWEREKVGRMGGDQMKLNRNWYAMNHRLSRRRILIRILFYWIKYEFYVNFSSHDSQSSVLVSDQLKIFELIFWINSKMYNK